MAEENNNNLVAENTNEYRAQRIENLKALEKLGYEPFGAAFVRTGDINAIRALWTYPIEAATPEKPHPEGPAEPIVVSAAGRMMACRNMGKTIFADLRDGNGRIQLFVNGKNMPDGAFDAFKLLDLGDHIGIQAFFSYFAAEFIQLICHFYIYCFKIW